MLGWEKKETCAALCVKRTKQGTRRIKAGESSAADNRDHNFAVLVPDIRRWTPCGMSFVGEKQDS